MSKVIRSISRRSGVAVAAMMRRSAKFHHRNADRGGARNMQTEYIEEYIEDEDSYGDYDY